MSEKLSDEKIKSLLEEREVPQELSPDNIKIMLDKFGYQSRRKNKIKHNILKIGSTAAVLAVVIGVAAVNNTHKCGDYMNTLVEPVPAAINNMRYAESYEDIYNYFNLSDVGSYKKYVNENEDAVEMDMGNINTNGAVAIDEAGIVGEENSDDIPNYTVGDKAYGSSTSNSDENYTNTYNQEEGVIEADIVKTDGKNIFFVTYDNIRAVQVDKGKFSNMTTFAEDIGIIQDIYLYNDMLIAISYDCSGEDSSENCLIDYSSAYTEVTFITVYSKEDYSVIGQYQQKGYYNDIRLRNDGFMYLVTNESDDIYNCGELTADDTEKYIPSYCVNEEKYSLEYSNILMSNLPFSSEAFGPWLSYINISAFDLNSSEPYNPTDVKAVAGRAGTIYCSMNNLYVTYGWDDTEITRFEIGEGTIIPRAGAKVKGTVNDQFSMSEYNGYFRIATTFNSVYFNNTNNALYVLDMDLDEVGKISNFGIDERIKSVNYNNDMAYIVTFRQTDPLYAIDLSDPVNPQKTDELKITGYSSYMQSWSEGMLLGFGESGDEDGALNGVKLTMFDNSDPENLKVIDSVELNGDDENFISSSAVYDRKALLISPKNNIIGIPIYLDALYFDSYHGKCSYKFYSFENGKFKELGELGKMINYMYYSEFSRSVIIDGFVYICSNDTFMAADIKDFKQTDCVTFDDDTEDNDEVVNNDINGYDLTFESYVSND